MFFFMFLFDKNIKIDNFKYHKNCAININSLAGTKFFKNKNHYKYYYYIFM